MCNFENIKKILKYRGKIRATLIFKECLDLILSQLAKGYSYDEVANLLQAKADEELGTGVVKINKMNIYTWGKKGNITPEKIEEYKLNKR